MKSVNESILMDVFENALVGYWDRYILSGKELMSPALKKMFGYEDSEIPNTIEAANRLIFEEDLPEVMNCFYDHVKSKGKKPFSCEIRCHHKNGSTVWVLSRGKVIEWDEKGNPLRMVGCNIDITEQKQNEEAIRSVAANLQAVLGSTNDIIASYDTDQRLLVFNDACSNFYRKFFNIEIHQGLRTSDFLSEPLRSMRVSADARALSGESLSIQFELSDSDGVVWSYESQCHGIRKNDAVVGFTIFTRDITERKRTEQALYESEKNYRTLVDNMQDAVYRCDLDGNITFISPSAVQLLGYQTVEDIIGVNIARNFYYHPEDRQKLLEIMKEQGTVTEYRVTLRRKDNTQVIVHTSSHYCRDENGNIIGIEGVFHDVTARMHAEDALRKSEEDYRSLVNNMQDVVYRCDLDGNTTFISPSAVSLLGCQAIEDIIGVNIARNFYYHPEDRQKLLEAMKLQGKVTNYEVELRRKDNSRIVISTNSHYYRDANGTVIGIEGIYHDITARSQAEEALKKNEALLRSVFEASPAGISLVVNRIFTKVNDALCRITGYSEDELLGRNTRILYFSDDDYIHTGGVYAELDKKGFAITEARLRHKSGAELYVLLCLSPTNSHDVNAGVVTTMLDITSNKYAEQTIKKNELLLRSLFESSPAGIALVVDRVFSKVNNAFCRITGYTEQELEHASTRILYFDEEEYNKVGKIYSLLDKNDQGMMETRFRQKNGTEIYVLLCISPFVPHDTKAGVVATILDITNIKHAELALKNNQALLQSIFDASPAGIALLVDRILTKVNNALCRITGYSEDEIVGKNARILYFDDEEYRRVGQVYSLIEKTGMGITEARFRQKNGTEIYVLICLSPMNPHDSTAGVIGTVLDITELKKMESEKNRLEEMLLHSQKLESIGRLAGGIAHDFNNMLTAILGNAELVKEQLPVSSNAYSEMEIVESAAMSAANLTRQLLAFSRKQIIKPEIINLNNSIKNIQKMLLTLIGESISLDINKDRDLHNIKADPGHIEQIILNLSVNARDAMPDGGKLIIETRNVILDEAYSKAHLNIIPGPFVMLAISDTGIGMSKEVVDLCFEPFFTTKEKGKGTGLGLSTVYGIVNQCGGAIEVYSEVGKGTGFKLYFPVAQEDIANAGVSGQPTSLPTGNETILIAEDNELVLKFCMSVLNRLGYQVLSAATGEEALNIALNYNQPIHLLVTDVILPGINGRETSVRLSALHSETKTLFTSGYTAEVIDKQGILDHGIDFISKPYTARQFAVKVREILDRPESEK